MNNNWFSSIFHNFNLSSNNIDLLASILTILAVLLTAILVTLIVRKTLVKFLINWIQNSRYRWDDPLAKNQLLTTLTWLIPVTVLSLAVDIFLSPGTAAYLSAKRLITSGFVIVSILSINALLSSINDIHRIVRKK
jgi:hypothetical protein